MLISNLKQNRLFGCFIDDVFGESFYEFWIFTFINRSQYVGRSPTTRINLNEKKIYEFSV